MRSQEKWYLGDSRQTLHRTRAPVSEHYELDFTNPLNYYFHLHEGLVL